MWCKNAKTSFTRAKIRYVKHPKKQKVLQLSENQLYHGKHPICQTSEKPKSAANMRKPALRGQTSDLSNIQKLKSAANIRKAALRGQTFDMSNIQTLKSAANIRKAALPGQTSDMSNIQKKQKVLQTSQKSSFSLANIRCVKHPKNQKVLQTCENQLYQGKHPICQTSEKPKSAANIRKPALPWRTSDMPNIRKTKKGCKHPKSSFTMANTSDMPNIRKTKKCCKHPKSSFTRATHPIYQTSKKTKSAANIRKAAFPGQISDVSNIRKTKMCCKNAKTSFTRANIRYVKHPKKQKVLQLSENQLYHCKHPICQTSEKPKSAANMRKPALRGQNSDLSNIQKLKSAANIRKAALRGQTSDMSNIQQLVLQTSEKQLCQGKHPICQTSKKKQKVLQTSEKQLFLGKHPMCQTSEKSKSAANLRKPALPGQTSDMSNI